MKSEIINKAKKLIEIHIDDSFDVCFEQEKAFNGETFIIGYDSAKFEGYVMNLDGDDVQCFDMKESADIAKMKDNEDYEARQDTYRSLTLGF